MINRPVTQNFTKTAQRMWKVSTCINTCVPLIKAWLSQRRYTRNHGHTTDFCTRLPCRTVPKSDKNGENWANVNVQQ